MPRTGNLIIGGRDKVSGATLGAGSAAATLPVTNLATQAPAEVWRTTSAAPADTYITADFGGLTLIDLVSLIAHNLTQGAGQWRIRLSQDGPIGPVDSPGVALEYDSGWMNAWPVVEPFGVLPWGEFRWGGQLTSDEAAALVISEHHVLEQGVLAQYLRIDLDDAGNADGYLQAGRLFVSPVWQTAVNFDRQWDIQVQDDSVRQRSAANVVYSEPMPQYRILRLALSWMDQGEAFVQAMDLDWRQGVTGEIVIIPRPDDTDYLYFTALYGQIARSQPIKNRRAPGYYGREYTIEELR